MRQEVVLIAAALLGGISSLFGSSDPALEHLQIPIHFQELITDRALIDAYQQSTYRVEAAQLPAPEESLTLRNRNPRYVRVVQSEASPAILAYRRSLPEKFLPLRGYRASILDRREQFDPAALVSALNPKQAEAAQCVTRQLARHGVLFTLAQVISILGPKDFVADLERGLSELRQIGFPTDLVRCFPVAEGSAVTWIAKRLRTGVSLESIKPDLEKIPFRFVKAREDFQICVETGEHDLSLLRMQAGGGYRGGVVPGGSIDVIAQVVAAAAQTDSLISVPQEFLESLQWMAAHTWKLRRTNHVTFVAEPMRTAAWSQDNGKAGFVSSGEPATVAPRYACQDEGKSAFEPAESFLMDGLRQAGHAVCHSALLFQGGNLFAVRHPKSGERILVIGEGEIYRNTALGLTKSQAEEAFRAEFGVDRCLVVPGVSYHVDFDVTIRQHNGQLVAFVNDNSAAAREIVRLGIPALERSGGLDSAAAGKAQAHLAEGRDGALLEQLRSAIRTMQGKRDALPAALASAFVAEKIDSGAGNLQTFLLAMDVLESASPRVNDPERSEYLNALRRMQKRCEQQASAFRAAGWQVVTMPSMSDLFRSINYLNGIQHRAGYLMPAFGGFYSALDRAAAAKFRAVLGPELRIQEIRSAECQRLHGGVHCTVAAYGKPKIAEATGGAAN